MTNVMKLLEIVLIVIYVYYYGAHIKNVSFLNLFIVDGLLQHCQDCRNCLGYCNDCSVFFNLVYFFYFNKNVSFFNKY